MKILLFEDHEHSIAFYPLTLLRPIGMLRCGILSLRDKWQYDLGHKVEFFSSGRLSKLYSTTLTSDNLFIKSYYFSNKELALQILDLEPNQALIINGEVIAFRGASLTQLPEAERVFADIRVKKIYRLWDLIKLNGEEILNDINRLKHTREFIGVIDKHTITYNEENIFICEGATIKASILNAEEGPIYIGKNAKISEGSILRGPVAICEGATTSMGATLRAGCTVGPYSVAGGELKNVIIHGFSNKAHDGYLGDSYLGEWVNLGAGTTGSNLKNNYSGISVFDSEAQKYIPSGEWKLGQLIGDFTHTGINTTFNSGTTVGICSNVMGGEFQEKHIPSFSWIDGKKYDFDKLLDFIKKVMRLKGKEIEPDLQECITLLYQK